MRARSEGLIPATVPGISIDSRSLEPGDAFFAIKGEAMDGHDFATAAMAAGADVLYAERLHSFLRHVFETNLAPAGRLLLSDPFRPRSLPLLQVMETDGWRIGLTKWTVGEAEPRLPIGVYEATRAAPPSP